MKEIILYPTETIYGLGVNVFDPSALESLFLLKGRDESQTVSWLVRDIADIKRYAFLTPMAEVIAEHFLPGRLTLVLRARDTVAPMRSAPDNTIGVRISSDPVAQQVIADFMNKHGVPLTCTSANVSGKEPQSNPDAILAQFGERADMITQVVDDGERTGAPSTVVRIIDDTIEVLREGAITEAEIRAVV